MEPGNMDHGGEAARPTTVESTDLGMAAAVHGGEAHMTSGTFHGQLGAAAARRASFETTAAAYHSSAEFTRHVRAASGGAVPVAAFHREPGPGVPYDNIIGASWGQLAPVHVVLVDPQLPGEVMPVHDNYYGHSALQHRPGAGHGVVLAALLPGGVGGAAYNGYYALQPRPGAGHGEVLGDLLPVPDGVGHGEVFVNLLPGGVDAVYEYDNSADYAWQVPPGAGRGELFLGPLPDGVGVVFDNSGDFAQQTLLGTGRADGIAGGIRDPNLGAACNNRSMLAEHLLRLLPFAGIAASSVAVNGLAAGPGSPAVAFQLFVLLLGGLFLVILHVLRV